MWREKRARDEGEKGDLVARKKKNEYLERDACKKLKQDMLDDLEVRGLVGTQYTDKVEEYINLWSWLQMLNDDVVDRGVYVKYQNGANQMGTTENKSLTIATRVSAQMLNIWTALGFREQANSAKPQNGGEDDEL